ncbi:hypothetical protein D3C81_1475000 [compost metagenome]
MGIEMLHLRRRDSGLSQRQRHRPASAAAVFRSGRQMIGVGTGAVPDQFCERQRTAGQRVIQRFNHQQAGTLAHHKAISCAIEGSRGTLRGFVVAARQGSSRREPGQADPINRCFRTATHSDVCLTGTNQAGSIANRLYPGRARRDRRTQGAFETVLDRDMSSGKIDQK